MNLNFIRSKNSILKADMVGSHILEICGSEAGTVYRAYDFEPEKNTITEIAPEIKKYKFISVRNCIYGIDKFYFASYSEIEEKVRVAVYEYDFEAYSEKSIFEFYSDKILTDGSNRVKIFILNQTKFLVQVETLIHDESRTLMGAISFDLTLYDSESGDFSPVDVADFKNNGINEIIPVSESMIMVKCGYSYIEDKRFEMLSEKEALIESIYLTNSAQLIADIMLNQSTGNMRLIDTAYFDKCITTPKVKDGFIFYEIIDLINYTSDISFVNINTLEKIIYRKENTDDNKQISPVVISNVPYIKTSGKNSERFLNLSDGLEDMEFTDESFMCSCGSAMFFEKKRRGRHMLRIYSYPRINFLYEEQYSLKTVCCKDDEYYIYIE